MDTFQLLSKTIQRKIWEMGWDSFTPVQDRTIPAIIETKEDVIISSGTASGKTEAAFLPILSIIEKEAPANLKVIYVSPLKALINNQFERIMQLCDSADIPIHRWHGDVSQSKKKKFTQNPAGILQITPESIESLFINRTNQLPQIYQSVDYIILDEIHSFIDNERGTHLRSLLHRMESYTDKRPRIIGLSATIDNFEQVKGWVNPDKPNDVKIIESKGYDKKLLYSLMYFQTDKDRKKPVEFFEDIRNLTKTRKAIIFCNSRGEVEELTHFLNRLSERENAGESYFAHHSSIDKSQREYVEKMMAESKIPKSVIATSSLELGIDIGDVDIVIQVDSTFNVSSLKQRLGRSGRKKGTNQLLQLYATSEDSLLQSLAVMELNLEGWIEPAKGYAAPYDISFHQIISICAETNGIILESLTNKIISIGVFRYLKIEWVRGLILHMIDNDILEEIKGTDEIIVGLQGERILRSKDFYAVFMTSEEYTVVHGAKVIGTLDKGIIIEQNSTLILSGKLWSIKEIDSKKNKIYVKAAVNGKPPTYLGSGVKIHSRIGEKMLEILCNEQIFPYIDEESKATLLDKRRNYQYEEISLMDRPLWILDEDLILETFTGTIIFKTLYWMLKSMGVKVKSLDGLGRIKIEKRDDFLEIWSDMIEHSWTVEDFYEVTEDGEWYKSKYSEYLPAPLLLEMHNNHEVDIENTVNYLNKVNLKIIHSIN